MWKQLDKLRQKNEEQKKVMAFVVALAITIVIAITWGTMFFSSFPESDEENSTEEVSQTASPFDTIGNQLDVLTGEVGGRIGELKGAIDDGLELEE